MSRRFEGGDGGSDTGTDGKKLMGIIQRTPSYLAVPIAVMLLVALVLLVGILGITLATMIRGKKLAAAVDASTEAASQIQTLGGALMGIQNSLDNLTSMFGASVASISEFQDGFFIDPLGSPNYATLYDADLPNETRMAYRVRGPCGDNTSAVVLMVHDLGYSSQVWIEQMNTLSAAPHHYCTIAIDLLGHGSSDLPPYGGSFVAHSGYLHQFMTEARLLENPSRNRYLMGHAFGSAIVMQYAVNHPGVIKGLVFEDPLPYVVHPDDPDGNNSVVTGATNADNMTMAASLALYNFSAYAQIAAGSLLLGSACSSTTLQPIMHAYIELTLNADAQTISEGLLSMINLDHRNDFASNAIPMLFITGTNTGYEDLTPLSYSKLATAAWNLATRTATLHIIGSASGAPHVTHRELFTRYVTDYLSRFDSTCDPASINWSQIE
jgi:pimeloyl-ACP methyl ester carboxylesterase